MTDHQGGILLVGGIPRPIGGVTNHIWRLALRLREQGVAVLDLYPAPHKYAMPGIPLFVGPAGAARRGLWALHRLAVAPQRTVHFHFSGLAKLAMAGWLLFAAAGRRRKILTLHNGDIQGFFWKLNPLARQGVALLLRNFNRIVALNPDQQRFYLEDIGVRPERVFVAASFLPPPPDLPVPLDLAERMDGVRREFEVLFVTAGYPHSDYRHEQAMAVVKKVREKRNAGLALCLYGPSESPAYREHLVRLADQAGFVRVFEHLDAGEFLYLLARADMLLRPFVNDSCGIVVGEAIGLGVPAVATDCCQRHLGAVTYPNDDYQAFEETVLGELDHLAQTRQRLKNIEGTDEFPRIAAAYR